jgi:hypothetical protein
VGFGFLPNQYHLSMLGFMVVQKFTMVITSCVQMFDPLGYKSSSHCQVSHSCIQSLKSDRLSIGLWFLVF